MRIKKVENIVLSVMQSKPETRENDFKLTYYAFENIIGASVDTKTFGELMLNNVEYGLPSLHSITRSRRKLFQKYPELKPDKATEKRKELEEEYREYARQ